VGDFYIVCIQNCNPRAVEEDLSLTVQKLEGKEEKKPKEND